MHHGGWTRRGESQDGGWTPQKRDTSHPLPIKDDEETLLSEPELEFEEGSEGEDEKGEEGSTGRGRGSVKSTLWVILMTGATICGRRILRGGFRELEFFSYFLF